MKHYETVTTTATRYAGAACDGCGIDGPYLVEVVIAVHEGEEGGRRDEYDYCDDCLLERIPALRAAGSRAPIITGEDPQEADDEAARAELDATIARLPKDKRPGPPTVDQYDKLLTRRSGTEP